MTMKRRRGTGRWRNWTPDWVEVVVDLVGAAIEALVGGW